ncbi:NIPSNAP family protein [Paraglaciecola aquimarina]|uniref:NIPSNAP family protein n=1 Tax=Paraglaciecola aquimarina TaxID=1235557 RepID=A0ABU3T106_9ALTE|nr:NIPSNAP family protein [Paraglaciecola aquimarina]MDU0355954.1 NIPSNAP family protein [Paraglaciecola aquimarina]
MKTFTGLPMRSALQLISMIMCFSIFNAAAGQHNAKPEKVYELRTYHTYDGKLNDLHARFNNHTHAIFTRLGMKVIAYWTPTQAPDSENTLIYILEHDSEADAKAKWQTFVNDPEWKLAAKASKVNGPLVKKIDVVFMQSTAYSPAL